MDAVSFSCDQILPITCQSLQSVTQGAQTYPAVLAALRLLLAQLPFMSHSHVSLNAEEWTVVLQLLLRAMTVPDEGVRAAGYHVLIELATQQYDKLGPFMQAIFKV